MKDLRHRDFVITISYGDFTTGVGGTDKAIAAQHEIYESLNVSTIHVFHRTQLWKLRNIPDYIWGVCIDGVTVGFQSTIQICKYINKLASKGKCFKGYVIHHLRDIHLPELVKILEISDACVWFYLHDYMTICPAGLIKNKNEYCGASFPSLAKCKECKLYNSEFEKHNEQIAGLFEYLKKRIHFVAPSDAAKEEWCQAYPQYSKKVIVVYHQKKLCTTDRIRGQLPEKEPLKVAFVGYQAPLKGWYEWKKAITAIHGKTNYELFQFGRCSEHFEYVKEVKVDFRKSSSAMTDSLREHDVDCAVLWSLCPETYSYTYYESWAADAFVLTTPLSGNIADQVNLKKNGYVAQEGETLLDILLDEKKIREMINHYRLENREVPYEYSENDYIENMVKNQESFIVAPMKYRDWSKSIITYIYNIPYRIIIRKHQSV